jgi:alkyldihydroxyacetonephosphate synthase
MRSIWAWGDEEGLPDVAARRAMSDGLVAMLGFGGGDVREPPDPASLVLPPARVAVPGALAGFTTADPLDRARHAYGKAFPDIVRGLDGDYPHPPDLVARPRTEAEVVAVLDAADAIGAAVVPFGGGTSVVGGVECAGEGFSGVITLDLSALDRVVEIDTASRAARVQAGAMGPQIEDQLRPHGLSMRHYPQSFAFSSLGGWIATRAGGHFATGATRIDDLVESVRMITPIGVWEGLRVPSSGAGPSPDRLALGSEGALGVITEAWVRVFERPKFRASRAVKFAAFADGVGAVRAIVQSGLQPANCRLLDEREARLFGVTADGNAVLLLAFESAHHPVAAALDLAVAIAADHRGIAEVREARATDEGDADRWRAAFLGAPYLQSALITLGMVVDTFETACTWDRFDALHADIVRSVRSAMKSTCGKGAISCRFTHVYPDGPAPYYTFVAPPAAGGQIAAWREIKAAAGDAIRRSGGTITHHHAVGRTHRPWYDAERPEPFALALKAAKRAVDPRGMLNPGVLIDR